MNLPQHQVEELKKIAPDLSAAEEGGYTYILIKDFPLPEGCSPAVCDLLLCVTPRDGYQSRLFFPEQVTGCAARNWNKKIRALERNWCSFSWQTSAGLRLIEMLLNHLNALKK